MKVKTWRAGAPAAAERLARRGNGAKFRHIDVPCARTPGRRSPTLIQISQATTVLAEEGPGLGRPMVDTITGSKLPNLKELRPGSAGGSEVRMLVVFDPQRRVVFLVGGDKSGKWSDWYETAIPRAEYAYAEHLRIEGKK